MSQLEIFLPPVTNWQDLQSLVKEIASVRYNTDSVIPYGRLGQSQDGVDLYAEDQLGKKIGIQCKETKDALTLKEVKDDADKAISFSQKLDLFIVATTAPRDAKLQTAIISLNTSKAYPFTVRVDFWEDLINELNRFAMVLNSCYEKYRNEFGQNDEAHHLACLRIAFDRSAFKDDFLHEGSYKDFEEALVTTKRLFRTGLSVDRWSGGTNVQTIPMDFLPEGPYRKFVARIESKVEKIYKTYIADRTRLSKNPRYAKNRAGHYNELRGDLLRDLNKQLEEAKLQPVPFSYA
jgi:hypothetical protein